MKATLAELHRDTAKLVRPVIDGKKTLIITDNGEARAKIVPANNFGYCNAEKIKGLAAIS